MKFATNNNERMRITEGGNVGIGTTTPTVTLDVDGPTRSRNNLWANSRIYVGTSEFDVTTGFEIGYETNEVFSLWNYKQTAMRFGTSLNERMRIAANGNVGIRTNAPSVELDVAGAAKITGNLDMSSSGKIVNLVTPTAVKDAATKGYVDGAIPIGGIIMWSGTIASIPSNWRLCNGQPYNNITIPDLRDRFVIGARGDANGLLNQPYAQTYITGEATLAGGTKDAVVVAHSHTHGWSAGAPPNIYNTGGSSWGQGGGHTNGTALTINSEGVSGINQNLPPYYALAFIMRVS